MKLCTQCQSSFHVTYGDRVFYDKISPVFNEQTYLIPEPTLCPDCRCQRRQAWLNQNHLYHRTCDKTGQKIISIYSPDKELIVYDKDVWWSDDWDPMDHGREFDFSRPFFEQMKELMQEVPLMALFVDGNENSDYVNYCGWNKNCYLCFCSDHNEDGYYLQNVYHSKNTFDCLYSHSLQLCYDCTDCKDSYLLFHSQNSLNCSESWYLLDCINCHHCFGSAGLRNKEYCFFNEQLSKEEYEIKLAEFKKMKHQERLKIEQKIKDHFLQYPKKYRIGMENENVVGDTISNSKNAYQCFESTHLEDSKYCFNMKGGKDFYDINHWGNKSELCYESAAIGENAQRIAFCNFVWTNCSDVFYSIECIGGIDHCFGCVGLRKKSYCVLNKQYSKEEYDILVPKIIEHMQKTGEWGEFFPAKNSMFGYNETQAQEYQPLTKKEAFAKGFKWSDYQNPLPQAQKTIPAQYLPEHISEIPDDILNWATECEVSKKPFKLTKQELAFYKAHDLNIPRLHPEERYKKRMALRNPRKLWDRECDQCHKDLQSSYSPDREERVYCEECYLKKIY